MSETLYVKPSRPGLIVRDPETTEALPAKGGRVPNDSYWRRRRAAGDVVDARPPRKRKPKNTPQEN